MGAGGKNTLELIIAARDRTRGAFSKVGAQMKGTKGHAAGLNGAMNTLKGGFSNATSSLGSFGAALGPVGIAVAATAVVMATLGGAAFKASLEFEKAFATIRTGTGATGEVLAGLENSFKTAFTSVPTSSEDAATAIADLNTRLGLTGEPLELLAVQFLNLSRITGTDVAASISSATRVMHDFDVSSKNQAEALDYLFKVSQSTGLGMTQLGNSMTQYGSVMRQMGFDINESAALLGKFEKEGVNLELVLGSLRMGLANFAKAGEEPVEALSRVIDEIQGMGSVADANMKAIEVFGSRAGPDMAAAIREGRFSIEELMATLDASTETINKSAADTLMFGDKWTMFKNNITEAIAPIGDVITGVLGNAIDGLSNGFNMLQKIAKPALDLIFIKFHALKAFFEGFAGPIIAALSPLVENLMLIKDKIMENSGKLTLLNDIFVIITGTAKWLGNAIGTLVAMAITPLVAQLQIAFDLLVKFSNKLGPVTNAIGWVTDKVGGLANSFRDAKPSAEELEKAIEKAAESAKKVVPAVEASAKTIEGMLRKNTGNYKKAIKEITDEIEKLKDAWNIASEEEKAAIEEQIKAQEELAHKLRDGQKVHEEYFETSKKGAEEASVAQKDFTIEIGKTKVSFSETAAEVIKNTSAYKDLADNAATLLDLDWEIFTKLGSELPNIHAGIGGMESAFVGLKDVLEDNVDKLKNVKQSVMDIADIAAPFLEAGFLDGIKSIGSFAGALKDAGSAINTFGSLQDVSIQGCIDFSMQVHNMVSALRILKTQMEDLVPAFEEMGDLTTAIAEGFIGDTEYINETGKAATSLVKIFERIQEQGSKWDIDPWGYSSHNQLVGIIKDMGATDKQAKELVSTLGTDLHQEFVRLGKGSNSADEFIKKLNESSAIMGLRLDINTAKLELQTGQLTKITDALGPYLNFMRTLNELAALSTLSTTDLNNGLDSINDTLVNLGSALSDFDLASVMKSLFGDGEIAGSSDAFMKTMEDSGHQIGMLTDYIERLSFAIRSLVDAFEALIDINESVLADETALKALFQDIADVMANFTKVMGTSGWGDVLATGLDKMVKSAAPLTKYFQDNNAALTQFNNTILAFKSTLTNVIGVMDMLLEITEKTVPGVDDLAAGFDKARDFVENFDKALLKHSKTVDELFGHVIDSQSSIFKWIKTFAADWDSITEGMEESFESFETGMNTISGIIKSVTDLSDAFKGLEKLVVMSSGNMEEALSDVAGMIKELELFLGSDTWDAITKNLTAFAEKWEEVNGNIVETIKTFSSFVSVLKGITGTSADLIAAMENVGGIATITSEKMKTAFGEIPDMLEEITKYINSKQFNDIEDGLTDLSASYATHKLILDKVIPIFRDATSDITTLATGVVSLCESFDKLNESSITTSIDMERAMSKINTFIERFTKTLKLNLSELVGTLTSLDVEWSIHQTEMDKVSPTYEKATGGITTLIGSLMSLSENMTALAKTSVISSRTFDRGFSKLIKSITNFTVSFINNVEPLIASLRLLREAWLENEEVLVPLMVDFVTIARSFQSVIANAVLMAEGFKALNKNSGDLEKGFKTLIAFIGTVMEKTKEFYTPEAAAEISRFVDDIGTVIDSFLELNRRIGSAMSELEEKVSSAVGEVKDTILGISNINETMFNYGQNAMQSFINGLNDLKSELETTVADIAQIVKDYLGVESPTELGPLRDIEKWPHNLIKTFSEGVAAEMGTLNSAFVGMAAPITVAGGGGNQTSIVFEVHQTITDKATAEYSTHSLEKMLNRHLVM